MTPGCAPASTPLRTSSVCLPGIATFVAVDAVEAVPGAGGGADSGNVVFAESPRTSTLFVEPRTVTAFVFAIGAGALAGEALTDAADMAAPPTVPASRAQSFS